MFPELEKIGFEGRTFISGLAESEGLFCGYDCGRSQGPGNVLLIGIPPHHGAGQTRPITWIRSTIWHGCERPWRGFLLPRTFEAGLGIISEFGNREYTRCDPGRVASNGPVVLYRGGGGNGVHSGAMTHLRDVVLATCSESSGLQGDKSGVPSGRSAELADRSQPWVESIDSVSRWKFSSGGS